jgi:fibronectin type III domain protein
MSTLKRYVPFPTWRLHLTLFYTGVILAVGLAAMPEASALQVSPTTLTFQAVQGGTSPPSQIVNVFKSTNHLVSWHSSESGNATWVNVSPATGIIARSAQVSVSVNPAGLAVGTYATTVTFTATKGASVSLPVTFTVAAASSSPPSSSAATLTWNPDTSTNLAGYKLYVGTASGVYSSSISLGNVTSYTVPNLLIGNTYYFAVTAYNNSGIESGFSNEVSKSIY